MVKFNLMTYMILLGSLAISCNINTSIIDPIETKIVCNCEFRVDTPLNIVLFNPDIKNELKGVMIGTLTFDTIIYDTVNPLIIKKFEANWLRLKNSITNEYVFNQSVTINMEKEDYKIFCFYKDQLLPIIMDMKCWVVYYNHFYPPVQNHISFTFPFKVISSKSP